MALPQPANIGHSHAVCLMYKPIPTGSINKLSFVGPQGALLMQFLTVHCRVTRNVLLGSFGRERDTKKNATWYEKLSTTYDSSHTPNFADEFKITLEGIAAKNRGEGSQVLLLTRNRCCGQFYQGVDGKSGSNCRKNDVSHQHEVSSNLILFAA